jgi:hypothetical protein
VEQLPVIDGYVPLLNLISHVPAGNEIDAAGEKTYLLSENSLGDGV